MPSQVDMRMFVPAGDEDELPMQFPQQAFGGAPMNKD
jgi:hypothetical protein